MGEGHKLAHYGPKNLTQNHRVPNVTSAESCKRLATEMLTYDPKKNPELDDFVGNQLIPFMLDDPNFSRVTDWALFGTFPVLSNALDQAFLRTGIASDEIDLGQVFKCLLYTLRESVSSESSRY